ncbi:MAG TPA: thioredoxin family protein [Candidatus Wallbacteria bacterium]|nr:MAG: Thioredoxin C-2 [bacterium ADurb.Bin243]HOD40537.1 thioredoxin family protein [Candidatus Wallbacteria bacterium]HPG56344.1 thioredoxin family protein [Candidatus Wallbacteria bacterium]
MKNKIIIFSFLFLFVCLSGFYFNNISPVPASANAEGSAAAATAETSLLTPADLTVTPAKGFIEDTLAVTLATNEMELPESVLKIIAKNKIILYEFGAGKCAQCKQMKPIIEELQKELEGKVEIKLFDVGSDKEITEKHKIMLIPCQVFLDGEGKELFRHEGFFSKEEILAKLKELGAKL